MNSKIKKILRIKLLLAVFGLALFGFALIFNNAPEAHSQYDGYICQTYPELMYGSASLSVTNQRNGVTSTVTSYSNATASPGTLNIYSGDSLSITFSGGISPSDGYTQYTGTISLNNTYAYFGNNTPQPKSYGPVSTGGYIEYDVWECNTFVSAVVYVNIVTPPPTLTFWASSTTVYTDQTPTLYWQSTGAYGGAMCSAGNSWGGTKGSDSGVQYSQSVGPYPWAGTATYSLQCLGPGGWSDTKTVSINVIYRQPTVTISVSPSTIIASQSATISWTPSYTSTGTACTATGSWAGAKSSTSGSTYTESTGTMNTAGSYTYSIQCTGPGGSSTVASTTLTVNPAPTATISVSPSTIMVSQTATVTWSSSNATSCTASSSPAVTGWSGVKATSGSQLVGPVNTAGDYTLSIQCSNSGVLSSVYSVNLRVQDFSVSCSPASQTITAGGSTSFTFSNTALFGFSGTVAISHTLTSSASPPTVSYTASQSAGGSTIVSIGSTSSTTSGTYTLTLTGTNVVARSCSTTLTVNALTPTATISVSPSTIVVTQSATISWSSTNATSCTASATPVSSTWTGTKGTLGSEGTGTMNTAGNYIYSIYCTGPGGTSSTVSTTLKVTDFSIACSPSSQSITGAGSTTFSFTSTAINGFTSAITISHSLSPSVVTPPTISYSTSQSVGGTTAITVNSTTSTTPNTYTLTFTGTSTVSRTCSVTLNIYQVPTVNISVSPSTIVVSQSAMITWSTTNTTSCTASATPASATWTGSKQASGSQSTGTINTAGTYIYTLSCTGPGGSASNSTTLQVTDFSVSCGVATQTITAGSSTSFSISSAAINGFSGSITISNSLSPSVASPPTFTYSTSQTIGGTTSVTVNTTSSTTTGTYTLTLTGTNVVARSCTSSLIINAPLPPTVTISVSPSTMVAGQSATISWTPTNTYAGTYCTASGSWSGAKGSNSGTAYTQSTGTISSYGDYTYSIQCTGPGGSTSIVSTTLKVTDFSIYCSPVTQTISQGGAGTVVLKSDSNNGYTGSITWSTSSAMPSYSTTSYSNNSPTLAASGTGTTATTSFFIQSQVASQTGTYSITFTATPQAPATAKTCNVQITINPVPPQVPTVTTANRPCETLVFSWNAPTSGPRPTSYSLYRAGIALPIYTTNANANDTYSYSYGVSPSDGGVLMYFVLVTYNYNVSSGNEGIYNLSLAPVKCEPKVDGSQKEIISAQRKNSTVVELNANLNEGDGISNPFSFSDGGRFRVGDKLTFKVIVKNNGTLTLNNITVRDVAKNISFPSSATDLSKFIFSNKTVNGVTSPCGSVSWDTLTNSIVGSITSLNENEVCSITYDAVVGDPTGGNRPYYFQNTAKITVGSPSLYFESKTPVYSIDVDTGSPTRTEVAP